MQKSYKGYFAAVLIFIDAVVLGLSFGFLHAPSHYYVCLGLILAATVFYEIYRFQKGLRDFLDDHADIPFLYAFLVLACSLIFLRAGAMDMVSLVKTPSMVLNNSQFTMREEKFLGIFPHTAYVLEGSKVEEEKNQNNEKNQDGDESEEKAETYSFYITKDIYNSLSYALPAEELESDSKTQSYSYSPSAEFTVSYLSGSRKVKDVAMKTTAQGTAMKVKKRLKHTASTSQKTSTILFPTLYRQRNWNQIPKPSPTPILLLLNSRFPISPVPGR